MAMGSTAPSTSTSQDCHISDLTITDGVTSGDGSGVLNNGTLY